MLNASTLKAAGQLLILVSILINRTTIRTLLTHHIEYNAADRFLISCFNANTLHKTRCKYTLLSLFNPSPVAGGQLCLTQLGQPGVDVQTLQPNGALFFLLLALRICRRLRCYFITSCSPELKFGLTFRRSLRLSSAQGGARIAPLTFKRRPLDTHHHRCPRMMNPRCFQTPRLHCGVCLQPCPPLCSPRPSWLQLAQLVCSSQRFVSFTAPPSF